MTRTRSTLSCKSFPRLFKGKGANDAVRVWVPGCATGEEAYSLAILLREHMDTLSVVPKVQVFATDIDEPAIGDGEVSDVIPQLYSRGCQQSGKSGSLAALRIAIW